MNTVLLHHDSNNAIEKLKKMEQLKIKIEKANRKQAWGEHLTDAGFERDQFDNKYGKRIITWTKDGVDYVAKAASDAEGNLIISLTEYK